MGTVYSEIVIHDKMYLIFNHLLQELTKESVD